MSLTSGTKLGVYVVAGPLGAGGMGEVYRARDTKLNRDVAIKVLPAALASDPAALGRFHAEAQAVAALSHPNILAIFDFGAEGATPYAVMELLNGSSLRDALAEGALPTRKAVECARQIAAGLASAHAHGITHRDLKPENVFITEDGQVKILDFGLAKAQDAGAAGAGQSFTPTRNVTAPGTVLGTVGYMAPEQVRGEAADARADLFALGAVLYEMLSGRRAFQRDTAAETMTAILREDPADIGASPVPIPPALDRIVRHCLEKNPAERFQSARDIAFALEALSGSGPTPAVATARPRAWPRVLRWGAVTAGGLLLAWLGFTAASDKTPPGTGLPASWAGELMGGPMAVLNPRVSPSGQELALAALVGKQTQVAVMRPVSGDWELLTRDPALGNVQDFAWSHDNARLYFDRFLAGQPSIFWMPMLGGGKETLLLPDAFSPRTLGDGSLIVGRWSSRGQAQLYRFWPDGERLEPLGAIGNPVSDIMPFRVFPDGKAVVFVGRPESDPSKPEGLYAVDLESGAVRSLAPGIEIRSREWLFPLAVSPDSAWVLFDLPAGDLHHIVAVPSDGSGGVVRLIALTGEPLGLDVDRDWNVFVEQVAQPTEIRWYRRPGDPAASLRLPDWAHYSTVLPIDHGRVLVTLRSAGKARIMVVDPGTPPAPFIDIAEETDFPAATLGPDKIVLIVGSGAARRVAVASIATGRLLGPIAGIDPGTRSLAGSPDGGTVFYSAGGTIWAMPAGGGTPRRVRDGQSVAVDPKGRFLVVKMLETKGVRLFRVPLPAGAGNEQEIPITGGDVRVVGDWEAPMMVGPLGRLLVRVGSNASWYYPAAVLDPQNGHLDPLDPAFEHDMIGAAWAENGQIVTQATTFQSTLWRFRPRWK